MPRLRHVYARSTTDDSGVAMLMALFVIMVLTAVSLSVAAVTIGQAKPTQLENKTTRTVEAAQAGIDAALDQLRAATYTSADVPLGGIVGSGDLAILPCASTYVSGVTPQTGYKFQGAVNQGAAGNLGYTVVVTYYSAANDPREHLSGDGGAAWLANTSNQISCTGSNPSSLPAFAVVSATGTANGIVSSAASSGNRVLRTVYQFNVTNGVILGGLIPTFYATGTTNPNLCIDGGTTARGVVTVVAGNAVVVDTCQTAVPANRGQLFTYNQQLQLQIPGTGTGSPLLCIQADLPATGSSPNAATLRPCATINMNDLSTTQADQMWSYNGGREFGGAADSTAGSPRTIALVSGSCLAFAVPSPFNASAPPALTASLSCTSSSEGSSWQPNSLVGAGAAKPNDLTSVPTVPTPIVNYQYPTDCLDLTNTRPLAPSAYLASPLPNPAPTPPVTGQEWLIGYPCKQSPTPADSTGTLWNQYWNFTSPPSTAPGQWEATQTVSGVKTNYCLTVGTIDTEPAGSPMLVDDQLCDTTGTNAAQKWTNTLVDPSGYNSSYEIKDSAGLCLTLTEPTTATFPANQANDTRLAPWGYASVATCNGSASQKWNSPAVTPVAGLSNTFEPPNL